MSLCMCVGATFVVLTDCESCTSWISTNPGCMETGEYELTNAWDVLRCTPSRGDRIRRAAVDFEVGFGCGGISLFVDLFFFEERIRPAASIMPPCPIYLFLSKEAVFAFRATKLLHNRARPRERSDRDRFFPIGKKAS